MPLNSHHDTLRRDGELVAHAPAPTARIYSGALVCIDTATGLLVAGTDAAGRVFAGVAHDPIAPNTSDPGGVRVWKRGTFRFMVAAPAQTMVGKTAFLADDGRVSTLATAQNIPVGVVVAIEEGAARVRIDNAAR